MRRRQRRLSAALVLVAALILPHPAAALTDREAFVAAGAVLLSQDAVAAMFSGNTFYGRVWTAYYDADGRKVTVIGARVFERRWWRAEDGQVCQTLNRTEETACGPSFYEQDGVYRSFNEDGSVRVEFTMRPGNPEGL